MEDASPLEGVGGKGGDGGAATDGSAVDNKARKRRASVDKKRDALEERLRKPQVTRLQRDLAQAADTIAAQREAASSLQGEMVDRASFDALRAENASLRSVILGDASPLEGGGDGGDGNTVGGKARKRRASVDKKRHSLEERLHIDLDMKKFSDLAQAVTTRAQGYHADMEAVKGGGGGGEASTSTSVDWEAECGGLRLALAAEKRARQEDLRSLERSEKSFQVENAALHAMRVIGEGVGTGVGEGVSLPEGGHLSSMHGMRDDTMVAIDDELGMLEEQVEARLLALALLEAEATEATEASDEALNAQQDGTGGDEGEGGASSSSSSSLRPSDYIARAQQQLALRGGAEKDMEQECARLKALQGVARHALRVLEVCTQAEDGVGTGGGDEDEDDVEEKEARAARKLSAQRRLSVLGGEIKTHLTDVDAHLAARAAARSSLVGECGRIKAIMAMCAGGAGGKSGESGEKSGAGSVARDTEKEGETSEADLAEIASYAAAREGRGDALRRLEAESRRLKVRV